MAEEKDPLGKLYEVVHNDELFTGTREEFESKYSTIESQEKLYKVVSDPENQYYTKDFKSFREQYFPKSGEVSSNDSEFTSPIFTESSEVSQPSITTPTFVAEGAQTSRDLSRRTQFDLGTRDALWQVAPESFSVVADNGQILDAEVTTTLDNQEYQSQLENAQKKEFLPQLENILNNNLNQIKGIDERAEILTGNLLKTVLGEVGVNEFYRWAGTDFNQVMDKAFTQLDNYASFNEQVTGFTDSQNIRDIGVATVDATLAVLYSLLLNTATAGAGLATDMVGGSIYEANRTKANRLGVTVEELYRTNREDVLAPATIGALGFALERIGLRGVQGALTRGITSNSGKYAATIALDINQEGLTEWVQTGLEALNEHLANGGSLEDRGTVMAEAMFSKEGLESYLKGLAGTGVLASPNVAINTIANTGNRARTLELYNERASLINDLASETYQSDPIVRDAILNRIENLSVEIQGSLDESASQNESLSAEQILDVQTINNRISEIDQRINSAEQLPDQISTALQQEKNNLENQIEQITGIQSELQTAQQETQQPQATEQSGEVIEESTTVPVEGTQVQPSTQESQPAQELVTENVNTEVVTELTSEPTFRERLTNQEQRTSRIQELENSLKGYFESTQNLGISQDQEQNARRDLEAIRNLTEYAVLKIADGTIRSANALADAIGIPRGDQRVKQAYDSAQEVSRLLRESTVTPPRQTTQQTIRQNTRGGIQGRVSMTNREALRSRIRTLNEGAKLGKVAIEESRAQITALLNDLKEQGSFRGKVNATALNRVGRWINQANTPRQVERTLGIIQKVAEDSQFANRLAEVREYQQKMKRFAKAASTPKDLRASLSAFAGFSPRYLDVDQMGEYLNLAYSLANRQNAVSNVTTEQLQRLTDIANKAREEQREARQQKAQTNEAKEAKIQTLTDSLTGILGDDSSVISDINNGTKPLDEVIAELQEKINEFTESREERTRRVASEYQAEVNANRQEILDAQPSPQERAMVEEFFELNVSESDITKGSLSSYITTLYNLLNNNSAVGLGQIITEAKSNQQLSRTQEVKNVQDTLVSPNKLIRKLNQFGAVSGSQIFDAVVKNSDLIGRVHAFFGFDNVQSKSSVATRKVAEVRQRFNEQIKKYRKDLDNNPVGEVLMGIYSDVIQYRTSWTAEQIQGEYALRIQAWGNSLERMKRKGESNSEYARVNKNAIDNLEKALNRIADTSEVDGKTQYTPKFESPDGIYNLLTDGHKELYKFMRSEFEANRDAHFATSRVYAGLDVETDWVNYFPRSYTNIPSTSEQAINRQLASTGGRVNDIDVGGGFNSSLTKENTGSGKSRLISGDKLPLNRTLNPKSITTFLNELGSIIYDIETMPDRQYTARMLDLERNGLQLEDQFPVELYKEKVAQKILGDRFSFSVSNLEPSKIKQYWAKAGKLGTATALGGTAQFIKQLTPVVEILGRLQNPKFFFHAISEYAKQDSGALDIISRGDIALRNIENELMQPKNSSILSEAELSDFSRFMRSVEQGAGNLTDKLSNFSLAPLKITDKLVADIGWLALYMDYQARNNNGVVDLTKPSREAISFANTQNSIVMNESDPALGANLTKRDWMRLMFPFLSFSINSKVGLFQSVDRLTKATSGAERLKHTREITANLTNLALFNTIGKGIRWGALAGGSTLVYSIIQNADIDDEEKDKLMEELARNAESRQALNQVRSTGYMLNDFMFGGIFGKFTEAASEPATDYLIRQMYGEDELRAIGYTNASRAMEKEWYEGLFAVMGTAGIYGQRVVDTYKQADNISESDEKYVTRRFGDVNAEGNDIVIDDFYLDQDNISQFAKPEWERASVGTSLLLNLLGLTGLTDQYANSTVRYANSMVNNLLIKEHGLVSKGDKQKMLDAFNTRNEIDVVGTSIPLNVNQKIWYANEYFNEVLKTKQGFSKPSGLLVKEYESLVQNLAENQVALKFMERYGDDLISKQRQREINKSLKQTQLELRARRYGTNR